MKKVLYFLAGVILINGFLNSCQNDSDFDTSISQFAVLHQKQSYQINTREGLNAYIKATVGNTEIKITESTFEEAEDELGKFFLIKAKYVNAGLTTSVAISLSELETPYEKRSGLMMLNADCTMTCTPQTNCYGCDQEIIVRCQSQSCSCNSGTGGCSSSISPGGNQQ